MTRCSPHNKHPALETCNKDKHVFVLSSNLIISSSTPSYCALTICFILSRAKNDKTAVRHSRACHYVYKQSQQQYNTDESWVSDRQSFAVGYVQNTVGMIYIHVKSRHTWHHWYPLYMYIRYFRYLKYRIYHWKYWIHFICISEWQIIQPTCWNIFRKCVELPFSQHNSVPEWSDIVNQPSVISAVNYAYTLTPSTVQVNA